MELVSDKEPEQHNNQMKHAYTLNLINVVVNKQNGLFLHIIFQSKNLKKNPPAYISWNCVSSVLMLVT